MTATPQALVAVLIALSVAPALIAVPGTVEVSHVRRVFHNGEHNAFTDLTKFRDRYYLAFRSCPDGHGVAPSASIIILVSDDFHTWIKVHQFRVQDRDTRDPHFLVFQDKLFVYTGTWYCGEQVMETKSFDLNQHLGYGVWTRDGKDWSPPTVLEGTFGHYVWRATSFQGKAYLNGRRKTNFAVGLKGEPQAVESAMLESDDGLIWKHGTLFQELAGDETSFLFEANGDIVAVARRGSDTAQLCTSSPPYNAWTRDDLGHYVGGPLLRRWGNDDLVGGRRATPDRGPKTVLYWLRGKTLEPFAELPSGGDNSYPGFIQINERRAVVSWYSSHEHDADGNTITAIYMADLKR